MTTTSPPYTITLRTADTAAQTGAAMSVARVLAHIPLQWRTSFEVAGPAIVLRVHAPDRRSATDAVCRALGDPALRAWQLHG